MEQIKSLVEEGLKQEKNEHRIPIVYQRVKRKSRYRNIIK
jgi:hypothetical protein